MYLDSGDLAEAILFFENDGSIREMLYSEFEALLDGFIPMPDFASRKLKSVYLRIGSGLTIRSVVFFTIDFDQKGFVDRRWNLPLGQLADSSPSGPDLGFGPIRLACYSQCNIAWHQQSLWDPDMTPGKGHFSVLRKTIENNRLMFRFAEPEPVKQNGTASPPLLTEAMSAREESLRLRMAQYVKAQRLRANTLISQHKDRLRGLEVAHSERLQVFQQEQTRLEHALKKEQTLNQHLKALISEQAEKVKQLREHFEKQLENVHNLSSRQLDDLRSNYQIELDATIQSETTELKQQLQIRDIEMMYHKEERSSLLEEIKILREEKQSLLDESGDLLLEQMRQHEVSCVTYQPGVGHLTIPLEDITVFLEDSVAYVAKQSHVSLLQYKSWLEHYQNPLCCALVNGGGTCGKPLTRVSSPVEYYVGESDRCQEHRTNPLKASVG